MHSFVSRSTRSARPRAVAAALLALLGPACVVPQGRPHVDATVAAASAHVFRGTPRVDALVIQPEIAVSVPDLSGGSWYGSLFANVNGTDDSGNAVFRDGRGGEVTESDFIAGYTHPIGPIDISLEMVNYNFPNSALRGTTEAALGITAPDLPLHPTLAAYYDIDEVEGLYLNASISEAFEVRSNVALSFDLSLGWMDKDQAAAYVGVAESGLADLVLSARGDWFFYRRNSLWGSLSMIRMLDQDYDDAFATRGFDDSMMVVAIGTTWRL